MKFTDFKYTRPNMEEFKKKFSDLLVNLEKANSANEVEKILQEIVKLRNDFETMQMLVFIRHTIDTSDTYYEKEREFFDNNSPYYAELVNNFYKILVKIKFRRELEKKWGTHLFKIAELKVKTFSERIIEDLQKDNQIVSSYQKLIAQAKIFFKGEERSLMQMAPFVQSIDRKTRKEAHIAITDFFVANEERLDDIFDQLVKLRHNMALKLGYDNFVQLSYDSLLRTDYNSEMVSNFRKQVYEEIVPLTLKLIKRQEKRLGVEKLKYYDESLRFLSGNPTPKGDAKWMINHAKKMYQELSQETNEFFTFMIEHDLMDLEAKNGKSPIGYCTYINNYRVPFIFANFNGTRSDVNVLTHEAGHAFQLYCSRDTEIPEYMSPTNEVCEIHSLSMEFFTWPWMKLFFEEDEEKYKFMHLNNVILFIPYVALVDEFQHFVYENPHVTSSDRKAKWKELETKYLPYKDYEDNDFYNRGGYWFRQEHIFMFPFYYIEYALAQVCAFQYWVKALKNHKKAWESYVKLCKLGGTKCFLDLLKAVDLISPFSDGCIESVIGEIEKYLDNINDLNL